MSSLHDHPATKTLRKFMKDYRDFYDWLLNVPVSEIVLGNLLLILLFILYLIYQVIVTFGLSWFRVVILSLSRKRSRR